MHGRRLKLNGRSRSVVSSGVSQASEKIAAAARASVESLENRTLMSAGPRVVWTNLRDGAEFISPSAFRFGFDRQMASVSGDDAVVQSIDDPTFVRNIRGTSVYGNGTEFSLDFASNTNGLPPGRYTLTLVSGDGHFEDSNGGDLDGELPPVFDSASGDGTAGGNFVASFSVLPWGGPPPSPKDFAATPLSDHEVELQWFDDTTYEENVKIERAEGDGAFTEIGDYRNGTDRIVAHFIDTNAEPGQTYRYRARNYAYTDAGQLFSEYSNEVIASVLPTELTLPVTALATQDGASPDWLTPVGDNVFFTWSQPQSASGWQPFGGTDLWKTDGTTAGTERLFEGRVGSLVDFNGTLVFAGAGSDGDLELWKSDGTIAGTVRIADVRPGTNDSSSPRMLGVVGDKLLFAVPHAGHGYELWKTDGTAAGTTSVGSRYVYLDDTPETAPDGETRKLFAVSGESLYFRRATSAGDDTGELWHTAGSTSTQITSAVSAEFLTDVAGTLFFSGVTGSQRGIFKVPTGASAATLVKTLGGFNAWHDIFNLTADGGILFFAAGAPDGTSEFRVWRSDGTTAGTFAVTGSATVGGGNQLAHSFTAVGGQVYYLSSDVNAFEYFGLVRRSDGTIAGSADVRDFEGRTGDATYFGLAAAGRFVYSDGLDLWSSDGTWQGTYKIDRIAQAHPITYGPRTASTSYVNGGAAAATVGDLVFFSAPLSGDGDGRELRVASLSAPSMPGGLSAGSPPAPAAAPLLSKKTAAPSAAALATPAGVELNWTDTANNEAGFVVDRFLAGGQTPDATFYLGSDADNYLDAAAPTDAQVIYRVRSFNAAGYSSPAISNAITLSADIADVTPDPRTTPVDSVTITFGQKVTGVDIHDLRLTRNGGPNLLRSVDFLKSTDGQTYTLSGISSLTTAGGNYELRLVAAGSGIGDRLGVKLGADVTDTWTVAAPGPYLPGTTSDNIVSTEGEAYDTVAARKGKTWTKVSSSAYSGGAAMQALTNTGTSVTSSIETNSPQLDYKINFAKAGTYTLWVRGVGPTGSDDTLHAGLDGKVLSSADKINGFSSSVKWSKSTMDGSSATISVSKAGMHTLNLWMREDGFIVDKVLLTTNSKYTPSGSGPAASPRGSGSATPTPTPTPTSSPTPTPTQTVTLAAAADVYVRAGTLASTNFGSEADLLVKRTTDAERVRQSYVRFDLSSVSTITSAKLRLFGAVGRDDGTITVGVSAIPGANWIEGNGGADNNPSGEMTWNNKPGPAGPVITKTVMSGTASKWYEFDLTNYLKAEKAAGRNSVTLLIAGTAETTSAVATFASRETGANGPQLLVTT